MEHGMAFHLQLLGVHFIFHKQAKHGCCRNVFLHSLLTLRCACLHQSPRCVVSQGNGSKPFAFTSLVSLHRSFGIIAVLTLFLTRGHVVSNSIWMLQLATTPHGFNNLSFWTWLKTIKKLPRAQRLHLCLCVPRFHHLCLRSARWLIIITFSCKYLAHYD